MQSQRPSYCAIPCWNFKFFNEVAERPLRVQLEASDDEWHLSLSLPSKISNFDQWTRITGGLIQSGNSTIGRGTLKGTLKPLENWSVLERESRVASNYATGISE